MVSSWVTSTRPMAWPDEQPGYENEGEAGMTDSAPDQRPESAQAAQYIGSSFRMFDWVAEEWLAGCAYPRDEATLAELADRGVAVLINLHERPHDREVLARYGLKELHLPVPDFTPPKPDQLARGVAAIEQAVADGEKVAVHCAAGLGRTGTLLACYLVSRGSSPDEAIARVRSVRPGSVETPAQVAAVRTYAQGRAGR